MPTYRGLFTQILLVNSYSLSELHFQTSSSWINQSMPVTLLNQISSCFTSKPQNVTRVTCSKSISEQKSYLTILTNSQSLEFSSTSYLHLRPLHCKVGIKNFQTQKLFICMRSIESWSDEMLIQLKVKQNPPTYKNLCYIGSWCILSRSVNELPGRSFVIY
jgi:hypothetical protein